MSDEAIIGSVGVSVVPDASTFWRRFKEQTRAGAENAAPTVDVKADVTEAEAAVEGFVAKTDSTEAKVKVRADTKGAEADAKGLLSKLIPLAPAVVPLSGALVAAGAGMVGLGAAALAAYKGIQAATKAGTGLGTQYTQQLNGLKASLGVLEQTAARSALTGFDQSVAKLQAGLPAFNTSIAHSSQILGDITQHLTGGLVSGFTTFAPLINQVEVSADHLAARFEAWASGPGGAKFAAALSADFQAAAPAVEALATTAAHLVGAFNGIGIGVLGDLRALAVVINAIPVDVLKAAADAFIAFKVATLASDGIKAAAVALTEFSAASEVAAGAGASGGVKGLAGGLGLGVARFTPYAAAAVGAAIGLTELSKATDKWTYSNNIGARVAQRTVDAVKDLATLHLGSFVNELSGGAGSGQAKYNAYIDAVNTYVAAQNKLAAAQSKQIPGAMIYKPSDESIAYAKALAEGTDQVAKSLQYLQQQISVTSISKIGDAYGKLQSQIQGNVDVSDKFLKLGGPTIYTYNGVAVGLGTWNAALRANNGNVLAATGQINGMVDAMQSNRDKINGLIVDQQRLGTFQSDVTTKYALTTAQVDQYAAALGLTADKIAATGASEKAAEAAVGAVSKAFANGNTAIQGWLTAVTQFQGGTDNLTARVSLLGAGLQALQGVTLNMAGANLTAVDATEKLADTIANNKASISSTGDLLGQLTKTTHGYVVEQPKLTAGSLAIQQAMAGAGTAAIQLAQSIYANTGNANTALSAFEGLRAQFVGTETQALGSAKAANELATQIFGIPKDAKTFVDLLNKDNVAAAITALTTQLGNFSAIIASALVKLDNAQFQTDYHNVTDQLAGLSNTKITIPVSLLGPVAGGVLPILTAGTKDSKGRSPGDPNYGKQATGGPIFGPGSGMSDSIPTMLSNGEYVIRASQTAKHRGLLDAINSGVAGYASGGFVSPSLQVPYKVSTKHTGGKNSAGQQLDAITVTAGQGAAYGVAEAIRGNIPEARRATIELARAVNEAFKLEAVDKQLADAKAKLKTLTQDMQNLQSTVTSKLSSTVDPTKYADLGGLLSAYGSNTASNQKFSGQLGQLAGEGLNSGLLGQLAAGGSSAGLDTLAGATKDQIAQVNAAYSAYSNSAAAGGQLAGSSVYGAQIAAASKSVKDLTASQVKISTDVAKLVGAVARLTGQPVEVKLDGKVIATAVFKSKEFEGVLDSVTNHLIR